MSLPLPKVVARLHAALEPGEQILWLGHPCRVAHLGRRYFWTICCCLLMAGCGIALLEYDSGRAWLWRLLFWIATGLGILFITSWYWLPRLICRQIAYAVTDRRALIASFGAASPVQSFRPEQLREMLCIPDPDGGGSLLFDPTRGEDSPLGPHPTGFQSLEDPQAVETLIRQHLLEKPVPTTASGPHPTPLMPPVSIPAPPVKPNQRNPTSKDRLLAALEPEERVLWLGHPTAFFARRVPFGWIALVCFLLGLPLLLGESLDPGHLGIYRHVRGCLWFLAFASGLIIFPLRLVLLPIWVTYAVTDRQVLIASEFGPEKVRCWPPEALTGLQRVTAEGHWTSLLFTPGPPGGSVLRATPLPGFLFLKDVSLPESLIRTVLIEKQPIPLDVHPLRAADLRAAAAPPPSLPPARTTGEKVLRGLKQAGQGFLSFGCLVLVMIAIGLSLNWLRGPDYYFMTVAFSADGKRLAAVRNDRTALVWNLDTGQLQHQMPPAPGNNGYRVLYPLPSGIWYLDVPNDTPPPTERQTFTFRDLLTQEAQLTLDLTGGWGRDHFSPDGKTYLLARGGQVQLWDVAAKQRRHTLTGPPEKPAYRFTDFALHPDGKRLFTTDTDRLLRVWDMATARELAGWEVHSGTASLVRLHPDGTRVTTAGTKPSSGRRAPTRGEVKLWDLATHQELPLPAFDFGGVSGLEFSPNGTFLAATDYRHGLKVWDVATGKEVCSHEERGSHGFHGLVFSPDSRYLAAGSPADSVLVWEVATWTVKQRLK